MIQPNSRSDHQKNRFHLQARVSSGTGAAPGFSLGLCCPDDLHVGMSLGAGSSKNLFAFVFYRNKVIWVGIASQIIIALILSYGLGSIQALNFTMLR